MLRINPFVWKYYPSAGRAFFPGGRIVTLKEFQADLGRMALQRKISISLDLINNYGLASRVYLGNTQIANDYAYVENNLAKYLYENTIHPSFFADAIHTIASNSTALSDCVKQVQLRNLRRDSIAEALKEQKVLLTDLGLGFKAFSERPVQDRLQTLLNLGVIILNDGAQLPDLRPKSTTNKPEPKPLLVQRDLFEELFPPKKEK